MKNLDNYPLIKKKILVRVDLNVPVINQKILDKSRISAIKLTINKLRNQKNKIFLISHFGRPKGERINNLSLSFICNLLKEELNLDKIHFLKKFDDNQIKNKISEMNEGEICLFENIRFYAEEENNDLDFSKQISKNFDVFVNDAFSASHRIHASIVGITKFLPSVAGYSMVNEIKNINLFVNNFKKPNLAIIGGSKISSKIDLLFNLGECCDAIVIGGGMANTFLFANKIEIGRSLLEKDLSEVALSIIKKAKQFNCEIIIPVDVVCADELVDCAITRECDVKNISPKHMVLDVGPKTIKIIENYILKSKMILWNGPLGAFEYKPFEKSSIEIANIIKNNSKSLEILSIAGGGDTVAAIKMANAEKGFSYISKAGGAFLEWLEGKESPGVLALKENNLN